MSSNVSNGRKIKDRFSVSPLFLFIVAPIVLVVGGVIGVRDTSAAGFAIIATSLVVVVATRQDELAAAIIVAIHIYVDWYLGLEIIAPAIAIGLLCLFFLMRSSRHPWVTPPALWLWCLFLMVTIVPTIQGAHYLSELAFYYPNTIFGALVFFWLGMVVASNKEHLRTLCKMLAGLGALLAIHTLIQATTRVFLFSTTHLNAYLAQVSNFELAGSTVERVGSLLLNPDWNGTFFAMMPFLLLGLFAESSSFLEKLLYLAEMLLMLVALFCTYSIGAWIGALAGIIIFVLFVGRGLYRVLIPLLMAFFAISVVILLPSEINLQLHHLSDPAELSLRLGAWQTAIRVINAFPLSGVGLGLTTYLQRAEAYRVPAQTLPLAHPHNSYLEWGAMAGIPVLLVFLALLLLALWWAWRNWVRVDAGTRCLIGGGIAAVIALSVNSFSINGWTLPPMAAIGWLILGAISSPLLAQSRNSNGVGMEDERCQNHPTKL